MIDKKEIKELIKTQIVPYLIALRNEIGENKINKDGEEIEAVVLRGKKGEKGDTPIADKDYPSIKTVEQMIKDNLPKKGKDYFTDSDIKQICRDVVTLVPRAKNGKAGKDGKVDYKKVKELIQKKADENKEFVKNAVDLVFKAVEKSKTPRLSAIEIRNELESLKGSTRLDAKAIRNLDKYIQTFVINGGGGGGSAGTGGASAFTDLTDTFEDYTGLAGQGLRVNLVEDGIDTYTPTDTDEKVKVSANDTTAGYLNGKLVAGNKITLTEINDGLNETFSIGLTSSAISQFTNDSGYITSISGLDHNSLANLATGDVHTQYALLAGRSGGQTLIGGTASGNNLTLQSTSNATKGSIILGTTTYYDQVNNRLGINNSTPYASLVVTGTSATTARMGFSYSNTYGQTYWTAEFSSGAQNGNLLTGYINQIGGTGNQWIQVQGNLRVTFGQDVLAPNGVFYSGNGSVSAPSHSFNSDPDSGMYRISANTIAIGVAGGERIRIASGGFNGVSMSNPKVRWHVANNTAGGTHNAAIIVNNTNAGAGGLGTGPYTSIDFSHLNDQANDYQRKMSIGFEKITTFSRGDMVISLDGSADDNNVDYIVDEKLRLTMAGNFGIGTIGQTISARIHVISTTVQQRLGYDASNYFDTTVGSAGNVIFESVGSGAGFTFNNTVNMADGVNFTFNTTTGTKIGTATSQKIGFWNATPIIQPTTAIASASFVANTSGIVDDTATFDGYTIGQVAKALRNAGLLA